MNFRNKKTLARKNLKNPVMTFFKPKILEKVLAWLLMFGLGGAVLIGFGGIFLITLGFDEAWILSGIQNIIQPQEPGLAVGPVLTSGGLYALAQLVIAFLAGNELWAHRLFTFFCFLATGVFLTWLGYRRFGSTLAGLIVAAALLLVPGTLVFASTYATMTAFLCVLVAIAAWEKTSKRRWIRWSVCGCLVGLAAATRFECIALIPAIILWSLLRRDRRYSNFTDSLLVCMVAIIVFLSSVALLRSAGIPEIQATLAPVGSATGMGGSLLKLDYQRVLNKWILAESHMPLFLMTLATLVASLILIWEGWVSRMAVWTILIPFGWLLWAAWLMRAPYAHLRYLWPALAAFAVVIGLGLGRLYQWGQETGRTEARLSALIIAVTFVFSGLGSGVRNILHGNGNLLSFEWERSSTVNRLSRFQYLRDQLAAVDYLRSHFTPDETIGIIGLNHELRYLTNRRLFHVNDFRHLDQLPKRLMVSPIVGTYIYLKPDGYRWIEENCVLEAQFGGYSFYRVIGTYPKNLDLFRTKLRAQPANPLSKDWIRR